ncbi:putative qde-2-interacting protein [Diplodia seriata]|uniref:Putative qde-2-interacting protein n=1 Tax=Diplodia seriata TaxID=420778 RepID=A0A0G2H6Y8_9PEZI|nr:putative qde-2-interacting protein [Diplodia seriata]
MPQVVDAFARTTINAERVEQAPTQGIVPSNTEENPKGEPANAGNESEELTTPPQPNFESMTYRERLVWALNHDALLVAIDVENYMGRSPHASEDVRERKPTAPTEIGISISDPLCLPTDSRFDVIQRILQSKARHVRAKETSHLTNPSKHFYQVCPKGCEDHFEFGQTEFTSIESIKQILREMLMVPRSPLEPERGLRPVALLLHDARGDQNSLVAFGLNLSEPAWSHIFIVDTQQVADPWNGQNIGLKNLMLRHDISYDHAHNSGNDAIRTLVAGLIDGIRLAVAQSEDQKMNL